jgi:poly(A) polymerase
VRVSPSLSERPTVPDALPETEASIVRRLGHAFAEAGQELVLVGGIVRDALLGRELPGTPSDLDFATNAVPERTQAIGEAAGASSAYLVGARFGTVGLVFEDEEGAPITAEITTYRSEHYPDETRHPEVAFGERLEDDLARRDFTVNAIAADAVTGAVIDPFEGQADLARGILRAVGEPENRFQEDPLRLLRAARFVAQLGFLVEPETAAAMIRQAPSLARISKERIYGELTRLLTGQWASHGLETLRETGLFAVAMPELAQLAAEAEVRRDGRRTTHREKDLWEHTKKVVDRAPARPVVRWAALLHDAAKPQTRTVDASGEVHFFGHEREGAVLAKRLLGRLKADRATQVEVARLVELHLRPATYEPDWTDSAVRRLMLEADGVLDDLLDLAAADVTSAREQKQRAAARRIELLRTHIRRLEEERALAEFKSPLDGDELMRLFDRPPGRWIAEIKDHLRELVLDGELAPDDKAGAEEIARGMIERGEM